MTASLLHSPVGAADRNLAHYVRRTVYPYSAYYRAVFDQAGIGAAFRGRDDLGRVPVTDLSQVTDPGQLVLRPNLGRIVREGHRGLAARALAAKAFGGMHGFNERVVERRYKPVHWVLGDGVPLGYSIADLQRLAGLGAAWLERAGVHRDDVLLSLVPAGPSVAYWQLVLGSRRAHVSAIHLDPQIDPAVAERLAPSVIAGDPQQLISVLARGRESGHRMANLRTILAVGDPLGTELRRHLQTLGGGASVVGAWAPGGVRALWSECRKGAEGAEATGYHAWDDEVLEVATGAAGGVDGELLWTGLEWKGSAVLRLRTFTTVSIGLGLCPACGKTGPRVVPLAPILRGEGAAPPVDSEMPVGEPARILEDAVSGPASADFASPVAVSGVEAVLDGEKEIAAWQVEYRTVGGQAETIVVLAPAWGAALVPLLRRLDRHLRATQFVVLTVEEVADRVDAAGGRRILGGQA